MKFLNENKICIYHGNCADGFGAALVVHNAAGNDLPLFHAGVYQQPPPNVENKHVVMVDFSYKRPVLLEMAERAKSILILDHHKTAAEDLVDLPSNVETVFDMNRSGAMITWDYFNPGVKAPALVDYIQDRDLWQFKLDGTREIQAAIFSYPYDFDIWNKLLGLQSFEINQSLRKEGEAIERKHFKDIKELLPIVTRTMQIATHTVEVANLPYIYSSDAGHLLASRSNGGFGACYWDTPEGRIFSLRSCEDGLDVSAIAKLFGGGGHKHAAGFSVSYSVAATFEITQGESK